MGKSKLKSGLAKYQIQKEESKKLAAAQNVTSRQLKNQGRSQNRKSLYNPTKGTSLFLEKLNNMTNSKKAVYLKERLKHAKVLYNSEDRILLLGEGNFSFASSLCKILVNGTNVYATCYDSEDVVIQKYSEECREHINTVKGFGGKVFYEIDGTQLNKYKKIFLRSLNEETNGAEDSIQDDVGAIKANSSSIKFNKIVFNFPHCGLGIKDQTRNIEANQKLLLGVFKSAYELATPDCELHITIKSGLPYEQWRITSLVKEEGHWISTGCVPFNPELYPGYEHRRTLGYVSGKSSTGNEEIVTKFPKTFIFKPHNQ